MIYFIDSMHESNYENLLKKANVTEKETTIKAVLYLLASSQMLVENYKEFFVIPGKYINPSGLEIVNLSAGEKKIVALAFNLFNGYESEEINVAPYSLFSLVDNDIQRVFLQAVEIKFSSSPLKKLA